ncbi:Myb-like DNA-binding domain-containing protein [Metabacillus endolithicus]|uniref:Myb-like DNA-binding domain-containing protein n=1 Tax=Metabacillus endolithicus TaxID=1535204 RepID=A0ABW5BUL1_9BACI|nr:Myb-like DNA-binding domain-containing protein [Metabacillus endolithicus]UPG64647.1 hypothetical protein MVE64_06175 [Metabacillus endolithicus]
MKNRHDAWTQEEDRLLAKTVVNHIKDGSTQTAAFNEISDKINRTPAACSYRWNAEVRKEYVNDIELAKKKHKENKRKYNQHNNKTTSKKPKEDPNIFERAKTIQTQSEFININDCIIYLNQLNNLPESNTALKEENNHLQKEKQALYKKNKELVDRYKKLTERKHKLEEEYKVLMILIQHAQNTSEEELKKEYYH